MHRAFPTLALSLLTVALFAGCTGSEGGDTVVIVTTTDSAGKTVVTSATVAENNPFPMPGSKTTVSGSGATFPKPLLETWGIQFAKKHSTVQVSYAGGGSGKGITDITNKDVVFGASDAPLQPADKDKAPDILQIPETLGLVAVVYRIDGVSATLHLTGDVVGRIYAGDIRNWNHADIQALNPDVSLPDKSISIVYRSDSSGTTYVFTDFLVKSSTSWATKMGSAPSKKPDWTKSGVPSSGQLSGNGNDGVASQVNANDGTIGYVELAYVNSLNLKAAAIKNKAGEWVTPSTEGASKAAAAFSTALPKPDGDWSTVSIIDGNGTAVYPISSFTYILVYAKLSDYGGKVSTDQMNGFRAWLWWGLHDGQSYSEALGYAKLPAEVVKLGEDALQGIQV